MGLKYIKDLIKMGEDENNKCYKGGYEGINLKANEDRDEEV